MKLNNYGMLQVTFDDGSVGWYEAGWGPMMSETAFFVKDVISPNGCVSIVMGPLAANPFPDGTRAFFDAMGGAIGLAMGLGGPLPVETPLSGLSKTDVVRRAAGLPIELTFSCLNPTPDHGHCGECNKCAERRRGFAEAGVDDPTVYAYGSRSGAGST